MATLTFHLIANAHLDPVWLWDWREGMNEGIITCRTMLDLMDRHPSLTFMRGEAAIYEHIERTDPGTFARIVKYARQGRWDVVGGTYIQPDTNMPATETFARHYARGQQYFLSRFGKAARAAWAADSFGHAEGLPEVLAAAGIKGFAFTRPGNNLVPIAKPAFWWQGPGGSRVLSYRPMVGWYGNERGELPAKLDLTLEAAKKFDLENVGVFHGVGDHGGGSTERMIADVEAWAGKHPEVKVIYSGLHGLIDALYDEVRRKGDDFLPTHRGEMNFVQRGCYASVAKLKFLYRKTEALLAKVETIDSAVKAALDAAPADLGQAWDAVMFNSFHDILPGSSIERAYDEQLPHLGLAYHEAQEAELDALNALAMQVDTSVAKPKGDMPSSVAALVFNPHPRPVETYVELEASLDYRPIFVYKENPDALPIQLLGPGRKPLPFQVIQNEHNFLLHMPWRRRVLAPVRLPAAGWNVLEFGWIEGARKAAMPATKVQSKKGKIDNGIYRVQTGLGRSGVRVFHNGKPLFGREGLWAGVVEDPWGSWGAMDELPEGLSLWDIRERWRVADIRILEHGPLRAAMWVRLAGKNSSMELTFSVTHGRAAIDVSARVLWNERSARLRLVMPSGCDRAEFDVPGATVTRPPCGEVPGGRWARVMGKTSRFGFASDALYSFECKDGMFAATICRASRYSDDKKVAPQDDPQIPAVDRGELKFRFLINPGDDSLPAEAALLEQPPTVLLVPAKPGKLPRAGSLAELRPEALKFLALKPAADGKGWILRVQNVSAKPVSPRFTWQGCPVALDKVPPGKIACWRLTHSKGAWKARRTNIVEQ
jgi:alpha-mannosidase